MNSRHRLSAPLSRAREARGPRRPGACDPHGMSDLPEPVVVRLLRDDPAGRPGLAALLADYHLRTEQEKGVPVDAVADLPERYRREVTDPAAAFTGDDVLLACSGGVAVGCVVLTAPDGEGRAELKRLWTTPSARGRGVASRLLDAALERATGTGATSVRLSVWSWRTGALALYERFGFARAASWDERPDLVCMERVVPVSPAGPRRRETAPTGPPGP